MTIGKIKDFISDYTALFFMLFIAFGWLVAWVIYVLFAVVFFK